MKKQEVKSMMDSGMRTREKVKGFNIQRMESNNTKVNGKKTNGKVKGLGTILLDKLNI